MERCFLYFDRHAENGSFQCKLCKRSVKCGKKFNLTRHLQMVHEIQIEEAEKVPKIKIALNKNMLLRTVIGLVTEDGLPLKILDSPNLKRILDPICDGLSEFLKQEISLNSHNCKNYLKSVYEYIQHDIKEELSEKLFSLKIDSASRQARSFFGISAQFIKDDTVQSRLLAMVELKGVNSSKLSNLASEILKTLTIYGVNIKQIISITSDSGSNMLKTTKVLSQYSMVDTEDDEFESPYENDAYIRNIDNYVHFTGENIDNIQICRCAAHTAQLCALDVLKDKEIKEYVLTCRNFTKFIRKASNGYRDLLEVRKLRIPQIDCPTRWGSTYKMIKDLLAAKDALEAVESVVYKCDDENFLLTELLWKFMQAYVIIFAPLNVTIIKYQEENLNYGDFYAQWLKCKLLTANELAENMRSDNIFIQKIGNILLEKQDMRSKKLMDNEILKASLYLDPRFHCMLNANERNIAIAYLKNLWDRQSLLKSNTNLTTTNVELDEHKSTDKGDCLLNKFLKNYSAENENISAYTKIERLQLQFQRSEMDILSFWKSKKQEEPEMYILSNICFAVPPTQISIEISFSTLKLILTDVRNRLSHDMLE